MEIKEEKKDGIMVLSLKGRLDALTAKSLEDKFFGLIESQEKLFAIDFRQLDYISSGGLRVLLKAAKALKKDNGKIILFALKDPIKEIFEISGFITLFSIFPDEAGALKSFQ
ncbi:MAG: STAS domain-containing protein [Nitrospirota bacterium]|nr:MAG: STAS domain-containing protein [Nitrospirota bacterium]